MVEPTNTNIPPQPSIPEVFEPPVKISRFESLKAKWLGVSRRKKLIIVSASLLVVSVLSAPMFPGGKSLIDLAIKKNRPLVDSGNWTKLVLPERNPPFFTLEPITKGKFGILPREEFTLTTINPVDESFIESHLTASVPVNVSSIDNQKFSIVPVSSLGQDEPVSFRLNVEEESVGGITLDRDYSWAFQTQGKFEVVSTIPGDQKTNVPVNTGIEFVFSHDAYKDPAPYIVIEPSIEFRLERRAETLSIVPLKPLNSASVYTVTLKRGLGVEQRNEIISEDTSFTFQTQAQPVKSGTITLYENLHQASTSEAAVIKVFKSMWDSNQEIKTRIFRFSSMQEFIDSRESIDTMPSWWSYYSSAHKYDSSKLNKTGEANIKLQTREEIDFLQLPEALVGGYYLIEFDLGDNNIEQLWLQSTDVSAYVSLGQEQTVVWANKVGGGALMDARVVPLGGGFESRTNDQGWSVFNSPQSFFQEGTHYIQVISQENGELLLPVRDVSIHSAPGELTANDYWSYIYHERKLYKKGDTVYFWGVAKNRNTNVAPESVQIRISNSYTGQGNATLSTSVTPGADGSFIGSIKLEGIDNGWFYLTLNVGELNLSQSSFSVSDYVKPEMKIDVSADKKAVFANESVWYKAHATFFEGTPVGFAPIRAYESSANGKNVDLKADQNGIVNYEFVPQYDGSVNYPKFESVIFTPIGAEQGTIEGIGSVLVFGSSLQIETTTSQNKEKAEVKINVFNLNLEDYNSGKSSETKAAPAQNQKVKLVTKKTWYDKNEIGTYYDFVEKVTYPKYEYIRHEETVEEKELTTDNNGEVNYDLTLEEQKSYGVEISVSDSAGRGAKTSESFYYSSEFSQTPGARPLLNLSSKENVFSIGDTVEVTIQDGGQTYPDTDKNRFLFIAANRGAQSVEVKESPSYSFNFNSSHIPNIFIGAVMYTGNSYEKVQAPCKWDWYCRGYSYPYDKYYFDGLEIKYKSQDSKLDLEISTESNKYEPGEEAKVSVLVSKNKSPVAGATVNLVLVDEALAAMGVVKEPSVLSSLYKSVDDLVYYTYHTHEALSPNAPQAEKGGGGGDRELFKDAAFFSQTKTNSDGYAEFTFTLPDNITSWVTYAQAITTGVDAGQATTSVAATKSFFVTSQFPSQVLTVDTPSVAAKAFGIALDKNSIVNFESVFYKGESELEKKSLTQAPFVETYFQFPKLSEGDYRVAVRGSVPGFEDGVILPLSVVASRQEFRYTNSKTLEKGESMDSLGDLSTLPGSTIKLIVTDQGRGKYYWKLADYCYGQSNRVEKKIAQLVAANALVNYFDDSSCIIPEGELGAFQDSDGGLGAVSWGGSNLESTLWAVYADPEPFDTDKLISFFESKDSENATLLNQLYAKWGLTLLGESKIKDLKSKTDQVSSYREKVVLALALATSGEVEVARDLYYDLLADYAYANKPYVRIQSGEVDMDTYLLDTSYALLLGSLVHKEYDESMGIYLRDYRTAARDIVLDIADIAFVGEELTKVPLEDTSFTFTSPQRTVTKELIKGRNAYFALSSSEVDNFKITVDKGKAEVTTSYLLAPESVEKLPKDDRISLTRNYRKVVGEGDALNPGDVVEVTLTYDLDRDKAPLGCYTVTDHLPSGFDYIENPWVYGLKTDYRGYMHLYKPSVVRACAYNSLWWFEYSNRTFVYWARVTAPGTYIAEPAFMQSELDLSIFQSTPAENVVIEKKGGV